MKSKLKSLLVTLVNLVWFLAGVFVLMAGAKSVVGAPPKYEHNCKFYFQGEEVPSRTIKPPSEADI